MLVQVTCTKAERIPWASGLVDSGGTELVLNAGRRMSHMRIRATTKSKFMYARNPNDRRETAAYMETDSTVASLVTAADATFNSNQIPLNYYPLGDITKTVVATYIPAEEFALAKRDASAPNERSIVWYCEGGKLKKIIVAHTLEQIVDEADTGTTTTTTTT